MNSIKILTHGFLTTIQDSGRKGYQQYGVPVSGVMDNFAQQLANILVGNPRTEAVIEITMLGPQIQFNCDTAFAITGANISPSINGINISNNKTFFAKAGDILAFSALITGSRAYLAVAGGFLISQVMGSQATYLPGGFGGFHGRKLEAGDEVTLNTEKGRSPLGANELNHDLILEYKKVTEIRVIMGIDQERFEEEGLNTFLNSQYTLSNQYDRMGYRFEGPSIKHKNGADIISSGINFGAIQVPGHGQPIIMMADRQTTGGYTIIANVISVDLPYLAQLKPGDKLSFKAVTVEEAQELLRKREKKLLELEDNLANIPNYARYFQVKVNGQAFTVKVEGI